MPFIWFLIQDNTFLLLQTVAYWPYGIFNSDFIREYVNPYADYKQQGF